MFWIIIFCLLYMLQIYSLILSFAFILISLILMILSGIQLSALFWVLSVYVNFYFYYWNLNLFLFWMNYFYIKTTYHLLSILLQKFPQLFFVWDDCDQIVSLTSVFVFSFEISPIGLRLQKSTIIYTSPLSSLFVYYLSLFKFPWFIFI